MTVEPNTTCQLNNGRCFRWKTIMEANVVTLCFCISIILLTCNNNIMFFLLLMLRLVDLIGVVMFERYSLVCVCV